MEKYEILEHTADIKIKVFGQSKEELFLNALFAFSEIQKPKKINETVKQPIKVSSLDSPALLVDFLNEVLYLSQTNKQAYDKITFTKFTEKEIEGELEGCRIEGLEEEIKAATYHSLELKQQDNMWQAIVLFDV